ncbi:MAG: dTDP-4-amino-4,6-dideoxygalactose transaminase [Bacteroidales bacterium]|nr:dTDP-4-amino-4,6-dideoxygalactose transaminase [Bacteroidales bacterium]
MRIDFNRPFLSGKELEYMQEAVNSYKLSGNGEFTKRCQEFFEKRYGFRKCLLTTSGTDALEMAAILCNVGPGDEVIVPSYTFVSSALAFVRQGADIVWADSLPGHPNIDPDGLEALITPRTRVIVVVHYAGMACDMDRIMDIAESHGILVVEDAAQAVDSFYKGKPLGGIGHLGCFSFHETKNITAGGEGGLLVVNDPSLERRAEIIWEKGTNRAEFFRGMVNKYGWVDTGSSFLPAEINAAFLWAQLENLDTVQRRRLDIWGQYYIGLKTLEERHLVHLPVIPEGATNNAHMFYMVCRSLEERTALTAFLKEAGIQAPFHYLSLHSSAYAKAHSKKGIPDLPHCDRFADCLVRLPLFYTLEDSDVKDVIVHILRFYESR